MEIDVREINARPATEYKFIKMPAALLRITLILKKRR